VADELDHWNSAYVDVDMVTVAPGSPALPFSVRDQNTNIFNAGVRKPIIGLGHLMDRVVE
jgi:hydrogenase/urease accessory protein HupE